MLIPDTQSPPVLDASLRPENTATRELQQLRDSDGPPVDFSDPRDMPSVSIERPQARLAADIPGITLPSLPDGQRLYVVRFDISLRSRPRVRIEWTRFRALFLPDAAGHESAVEDQHPFMVERSITHHVTLGINPSLKFMEVEASAGSYSRGYDYETLEPRISAAGRGGKDLTWDYEADPDGTVTGGKRMFALLSVPADMRGVRASLSITADLRIERVLLPARPDTDTDRCDVDIIPAD